MWLENYEVIQTNTYERTVNNKTVRIFQANKKVSVHIVDIISQEKLQFLAENIDDATKKVETFIN